MSKTVIKVENLSKQYRLGLVGTGTLSHDLNRWWHRIRGKEDPYLKIGETNDRASRGNSEYVWALRDINFEVKEGEVLGIIGKNGAGKSTLLKLLSKVTAPTTGRIKAKGRIASLLEVGTGFHPELTGRENIYLNGTILGMTKAEVASKLDEIVAFAGVERYLDTPVKRYSSGMKVRLGFAVAAHLEPEILIVDEVLAVGDVEFQKKAVGKMQDVSKEGGRTVLFVSHNMASVKALCSNCIVLEDGHLGFKGSTIEAINHYLSINTNKTSLNKQWSIEKAPGAKDLKILAVDIVPSNQSYLDIDTPFIIKLELYNRIINQNLDATIKIINKDEVVVFVAGALISKSKNSQKGKYLVEFEIPNFLLNADTYKFDIIIGKDQRYLVHEEKAVIHFEIANTNTGRGSNMKRAPGVIRPKIYSSVNFQNNTHEVID